jgi:hypothetical protein
MDIPSATRLGLKAGLLFAALLQVTACGDVKQNCQITGLTVTPATATADHNALAPGNRVQFFAAAQVPKGCVSPACVNCVPGLVWSVSDPVNVSIANNANDGTNGTATCLGATNGAVTITATALVVSGTNQTVSTKASLTCR